MRFNHLECRGSKHFAALAATLLLSAIFAHSVLAAPVYLSDLVPTGTPTNGWGPYEKDKSNGEQLQGDGKALTINGVTYAKGLGVHANSDLRFSVSVPTGSSCALRAQVGVDDEVGNQGSVVFEVWNGTTTRLYQSPRKTGADAATAVNVSLPAGNSTLRLLVTNGGDNVTFDHADWAKALVTCSSGSANLFGPATSLSAGAHAHAVRIADLNFDGKADLVTANAAEATISVLLGNGNGSFQPKTNYATTALGEPKSITIGDLNGDGALDLVTPNQITNNVSVLLGNLTLGKGDGTFKGKVDYPSASGAHEAATGDINKDGKLDVVVAGWGGSVLSVLLGNGDGTLRSQTTFATGTAPHSIVIADFNGDQNPDLATANHDSNNVSVLLGNGSGGFQARVNYSVGTSPHSIRAADLDKDGFIDLVTANDVSNDASVLFGVGNGTFQTAIDYPTGITPKSVFIADVNGDNLPDILIATINGNYPTLVNTGGDRVSVLLGTGNRGFQDRVDYAVGQGPFSVVTGDVNNDGIPDLATSNWWDANVTIRLGVSVPTAPAIPTLNSATPGNASVTLAWSASAGANGYNVYRGTSAGSEGSIPLNSTPITTTSYLDSGLTNGITYFYKIRAVNGAGAVSGLSNEVFATPQVGTNSTINLSDLAPAGTPTNGWGPVEKNMSNGEQAAGDGKTLTINGATFAKGFGVHANSDIRFNIVIPPAPASCTFNAQVGIDDEVSSPLGSVAFEVWKDTSTRLFQSGVKTGADAATAVNVPLSAGSMTLRLVATGGTTIDFDHGDWANAIVTCSGAAPEAPAPVITAASAGDSKVTLSWAAVAGATGYNIYRGTLSNSESTIPLNPIPITATSYQDSGLVNGTTYYYKIRALNGTLSSALSNEASARPAAATASALDVLVSRYDAAGTGANKSETVLTTSNVNGQKFGRLFSIPVFGKVYAQPLYVSKLTVQGVQRDVLYVATMEDILYAFDANTGNPLWSVNFAQGGVTPVPVTDVALTNSLNIAGNIGIESTPVIDRASNTIYLVVRTKENGQNIFRLHALDIATGAEKTNWPTAPLSGSVTVGNKTVTFNPNVQNQRAALNIAQGQVIISFGSHEDFNAYYGWVMAYDGQSGARSGILVTTPTAPGVAGTGGKVNGPGGGVWMSGRAPVVDNLGYVYLAVSNVWGNGGYDGVNNFSESLLKLDPLQGLKVVDWFTPDNRAALDAADEDFGSSGPMLIPGSTLVTMGGKDGVLYLVDSNSPTGLGKGVNNALNQVQSLPFGGLEIRNGAAIWVRSAQAGGSLTYHAQCFDAVRSYPFDGFRFVTTGAKASIDTFAEPGGFLTVSANGEQAGSGIVWAYGTQTNADHEMTVGELRAYNADTLTRLWSSKDNLTRDDVGLFTKYVPPVVVNGKVYVATNSNQILVYGLLPTTGDFTVTALPAYLPVMAGSSSFELRANPLNAFSGTVNWAVAGLPAGVTAAFTGNPGNQAKLNLTVPNTTSAGLYTATVTASSGQLSHTQTVILNVTGAQSISRSTSPWSILSFDSQETVGQFAPATQAIDLNPTTFWHTAWSGATPANLPHQIVIDLGSPQLVSGLSYLPRQDGCANGTVRKYEIFLSLDGVNWGNDLVGGSFDYSNMSWGCSGQSILRKQQIKIPPTSGRYVRFRALSEVNGNPWTSAAEIDIFKQ